MTEDSAAPVHRGFVAADPALEVEIDGPRGTFPGLCVGWNGDRVHVRWSEGPGLSYMQVLTAERVRRATAVKGLPVYDGTGSATLAL